VSTSATAPADQEKLSDIIAAFQRATDDVMIDIGRQLEMGCL
jgi:hypothetical protein